MLVLTSISQVREGQLCQQLLNRCAAGECSLSHLDAAGPYMLTCSRVIDIASYCTVVPGYVHAEAGMVCTSSLKSGDLLVQNDADMIALLISRGADVHQRLRNGGTCLHEAVKFGKLAAVRALTARGAEPGALDGDDTSAMQLAEQLALPDVLASLVSAAVSASVDTSLRACAEREKARVARALHCWKVGKHTRHMCPTDSMRASVLHLRPCCCLRERDKLLSRANSLFVSTCVAPAQRSCP